MHLCIKTLRIFLATNVNETAPWVLVQSSYATGVGQDRCHPMKFFSVTNWILFAYLTVGSSSRQPLGHGTATNEICEGKRVIQQFRFKTRHCRYLQKFDDKIKKIIDEGLHFVILLFFTEMLPQAESERSS